MTKKVLIIGGNSFIGYYTLQEFLKNNYEVTTTTRTNVYDDYYKNIGVRSVRFDLSSSEDINNLPKENFNSVILLAGLLPANVNSSVEDLELNIKYFNINLIGHINLLNYCKNLGISKLISTTSYADTINFWNNDNIIKEEDGLSYLYSGDHAVYVFSRNTASDISKYYNEQYGMKNIIFRFPPVYGVGPHTQLYDNGKLRKSGIALFIDSALQSKDIEVFGEDCFRDIVYVKDVANAFLKATESREAKGLYNVMSGNSISLYEQAKIISEVFSENKSIVNRNYLKKNKSKSYKYSIEKARRDFGYSPKYSNFKDMMLDYKREMTNEEILKFFNIKKSEV